MPQASAVRKSTLANQVTELLRKEILLGIIPSGSRLTAQSIIQRYNTSALPVREALQTLSNEHLLEINPYKGATVCVVDRRFICKMYDILRSMEVLIIESIVGHWCDELRRQVTAVNEEISKINTEEDVAQHFNMLNRQFHDPLEQFCTNEVAIELRNQYYQCVDILAVVGRRHTLERVQSVVNEHEAIIRALDTGDIHEIRKAYDLHATAAQDEFMRQLYG